MKRLAIAAATGCTILATVTAGLTAAEAGAQSATAASAPSLKWGACKDPDLAAASAQCALLKVPRDYDHPNGTQIKIAISRIAAKVPAAQRQGPLLVNPGGPGGSGLAWAAYLSAMLPAAVADTYDLIGFDPRGVGDSRPSLSCIPSYNKGPRPAYEPRHRGSIGHDEKAWLKRSAAYAKACAKDEPKLLAHLTTVEAARDLDQIRKALGAEKINYYGISYGSYLGQVYATLFPTRTRRLVFDGVVDPRGIWYDAQLEQDRAFQVAISRLWAWIASHDDVYHLGTSAAKVEGRFYREQDRLDGHPVGRIGPSEWNDVFTNAGYAEFLWPGTAAAFAQWLGGHRQPLKDLYADIAEVGDDNGYAMYVAVQCADARWPRHYDTWRDDGFDTAKEAPLLTWSNVWYNMPCRTWAVPGGRPLKVNGAHTPSVLLVNTTLDAATPFGGSLEVRRRFPHSALVAEVGSTTHADSLAGNECVDAPVIAYLTTGVLPLRLPGPGPDVACAASPLPEPEPFAATSLPAGRFQRNVR